MDISRLTDDELWDRTKALARGERGATADLVEHPAELDKRSLFKEHGFLSLFEYCVHGLRCSEAAAYRRIRAARAIRLFPPVSVLLRDGRLTLESVALLHPFLEDEDAAKLIQRAAGLRTWQVEKLLAGRQTEKPRRDIVRFCGPVAPAPTTPAQDESPLLATISNADRSMETPPAIDPFAEPPSTAPSPPPPRRTVRVTFSADEDFYALMMRARALLRHKYPDGRLEGVIKDALVALLAKKDPVFRWQAAKTRARR